MFALYLFIYSYLKLKIRDAVCYLDILGKSKCQTEQSRPEPGRKKETKGSDCHLVSDTGDSNPLASACDAEFT